MRSERYKTIRQLTKPSTAVCNLNVYTLFRLRSPSRAAAAVWQKSLKMSIGDSINRFLLRERYEPLDLFEMVKTEIEL